MASNNLLKGLGLALLVAGLGVAPVLAGEACCHMKGAKGKDKSTCRMSAKELKDCPMTDKRASKTDREMFVCPEMDFCSDKAGKCPTDGKKLLKKYCPVKEAGKDMGAGAAKKI